MNLHPTTTLTLTVAEATSRVRWDALAAIATFLAVLAALYPIHAGFRRVKAHAKVVRMRFALKLIALRPTLIRLDDSTAIGPVECMGTDSFMCLVADLDPLLADAVVLDAEEQAQVALTFLQLGHFARSYQRLDIMARHGARSQLKRIDETLRLFERHGLQLGGLEKVGEPLTEDGRYGAKG